MASNTTLPKLQTQSSIDDGYTVQKDVFVPMRDGVELCVDIFLPLSASQHGTRVPAICSMGPHGKDIHPLQFGQPNTTIYTDMYQNIKPLGPHACFELMDPLIWTKEYGYAIVRADMRGIGSSQGRLDPHGLERCQQLQIDADGQDLYDLTEWVASQPWCSGKTAFAGISYYGMVGYWAAMQKPPHLAAVVSYESSCDLYKADYKGGIYSAPIQTHWLRNLVLPQQRGRQEGESEETLAANCADYLEVFKSEFRGQGIWAILDRLRRISDIEVPFYLAGNWSDCELHLPGNILAFNGISSKHKWLEMHNGNHLASFYSPEHVKYQRMFLDHFLMGKTENGMLEVPMVRLAIRNGVREFYRAERTFPPPDAELVSFFLAPNQRLTTAIPDSPIVPFTLAGLRGSLKFLSPIFENTFELLGTPYLELEVSTEARDMNLFLTLRARDLEGEIVILRGNHDEPMDSICRASFRLSHREDDRAALLRQKVPVIDASCPAAVERGKVYSVVVPLLPTTYIFDKGTSFELELGTTDPEGTIPIFQHVGGDITTDRFGGRNTVFSHGTLFLPTIRR